MQDTYIHPYTYYICKNIHPCIHTYIYMHAYYHLSIHRSITAYIRTYLHIYIHIYIHTYIHTYMHAYIDTYIHTYIHITGIIRTFVYVEISVYVVMLHSAIFTQIKRIIIYFDHFRFSKDKHLSMQMKPCIPSKEWYICFYSRTNNQ